MEEGQLLPVMEPAHTIGEVLEPRRGEDNKHVDAVLGQGFVLEEIRVHFVLRSGLSRRYGEEGSVLLCLTTLLHLHRLLLDRDRSSLGRG